MADKSTANIGFEKQIWDAACVLRGNLDASEYKSVVLGLIFLKYISDRFEDKYNQLVEEGDGFEEDIDEYTSEGIFFVPSGARWSEIAAKAHTPEIGTVIDDAMRAIEKENKRLKDILPKNFARPELDKRRLGDVVDLFTKYQNAGSQQRKGCSWSHLRILPVHVCRAGRQAWRRILHAVLRCTHLGRDIAAVQGARVRPLLRQRRYVCAVGEVCREPQRQHQRYFHLRTGFQPDHLENGADEPCHSRHRA